MPLKGGTVADFSNSMGEAIEEAMDREWQALYGASLPGEGRQDRHLLFAAIANGILTYLEAHQNEILNTITLDLGTGSTAATVTALDLNV